MSEAVTTSVGSAEISNRAFSENNNPVDSVVAVSAAQLLVWALVATVTMLFAGFASAYLVRREGLDWVRVRLPGILWVNTGVLLASSGTIEAARRAYRQGDLRAVKRWAQSAVMLGAAFLLGQLAAWRQLATQGVYLPTNPYSSFFYMLTAVHGAHLLGGMLALSYLLWHVSRDAGDTIRASTLDGCATFWHFLDAIWICVYVLLLSF